jgi:CHAT domain-containing protein
VAKLAGVTAVCGQNATRAAVLSSLRSAGIVHLATHAVFCGEAPLLSAFLLANGEQLSVCDLIGVDSRCALIVASACETGQGRRTDGNDVLGIGRGLLACGAGAAVVTLWPVDDERTSALMIRLYERLLAGAPPSSALRDAQTSMLTTEPGLARSGQRDLTPQPWADDRSPGAERFWAPFVLVGA